MPERIIDAHDRRSALPAVQTRRLEGCGYGGQGLFADASGQVLLGDHQPDYVNALLQYQGPESRLSRRWHRGLLRGAQRRDRQRPALAPIAPNWIYGHVLLEAIPKIALLDSVCPPDWPLLLPAPEDQWLPALIPEIVGNRPILRFNPRTAILGAAPLVTATEVTVRQGIPAEFRWLMGRVGARLGVVQRDAPPEDGPVVYLSRSRVARTTHRISNEAEVEEALAAAGVRVVHPQEMPLAEQARALESARGVVGEYSSALHNAVFAPRGATVVGLNWTNGYQSAIARAMGHRIGYVPPADGRFRMGTMATGKEDFAVDPDRLLAKLRSAGLV